MKLENYIDQQSKLPKKGKYIIANSDLDSVTVYQAFNSAIAEYAVTNNRFGGEQYSFDRMTWIKPNFMWMMYRSGWATKKDQERILAVKLTKEGFKEILRSSVLSTYDQSVYKSKRDWNSLLTESEVRLQWDPDHTPLGGKLERKAIQIGLKGEMLRHYNDDWLIDVQDITNFVHTQSKFLNNEKLMVPVEREISFNHDQDIIKRVGLDWNCWNIYVEFVVDDEKKFSRFKFLVEQIKLDVENGVLDATDTKWQDFFHSLGFDINYDAEEDDWLIEYYNTAEVILDTCEWSGENTAKLICNTWSAPYGGFDPIRKLVMLFKFKIVEEWF